MRSFPKPVFVITLLVFIVAVNSQPLDGLFDTTCGNSSTLGDVFLYGECCHRIFNEWYSTEIDPGYRDSLRASGGQAHFQNNSQKWEEICRWSVNIAKCYESTLPDCNPGIGFELMNNPKFPHDSQLVAFYRRTCNGRTLKTDIRNRIEDPTVNVDTSCLKTSPLQEEFTRCARILELIKRTHYSLANIGSTGPAVNCMFRAINRSPCNTATKRILYHVAILQLPSYIDESELLLDQSTTMDFSSHLRCTVGVYGDPHLKMCFEPGLTTCSAAGPQTLIANGWFGVAGEHQSIGRPGDPPATSLRSIQLKFYSLDAIQLVATYTANAGSLPATFDGGLNSTVTGQGNDKVTIATDGYLVEFVQHSTGMILRLRQWSGNYFFTLRVAQGVIKKSYGLLASGCPVNQIISRSTWRWFSLGRRRKRAVTQESCETACNSTFADETFRDTCAFDCFATNDVEFGVNMTSSAEVDVVEIVTRDDEIRASAVFVTEKPSKLSTASSTLPTPSKRNTTPSTLPTPSKRNTASSTLPTPGNPQSDGSFDTTCGNSNTLGDVFRYGWHCSTMFAVWYQSEMDPFYFERTTDHPVLFQINSQRWEEICRWSVNMAACYESLLPDCNPGIGVELLNNHKFFIFNSQSNMAFYNDISVSLLAFYRRTCSGTTLKTDIQNRIEDPTVNVNTSCLITSPLQEEFNRCTRSLDLIAIAYRPTNDNATMQANIAAAEPVVNCMFSTINRSPCNTATKRMLYHVARLQLPSFIDESELSLEESTTMDFSSHLRCTVGVYGDPHLKMCLQPGLTTCSAVGPQTLIANGWFIVAGEHQDIGQPVILQTTSLRSIQLKFYSLDLTQLVATYTSNGGSLAATFDGGVNSTVAGQGNDKVTITTDGYRVEFVQQSTGMILMLRQWSGNYFFTLRVAQAVIKKSYGLLVSGCPANQIIPRSISSRDFFGRRRKRAVTQESCETACNSTFVDETFRDTCAFDCFATDDVQFGLNMTSSAEVDVEEIVTRDEEIRARAVTITEKVDDEIRARAVTVTEKVDEEIRTSAVTVAEKVDEEIRTSAVTVAEKVDEDIRARAVTVTDYQSKQNTASSTLPTNALIISSICYVVVWFINTRNMVIT